MSSHIKELQLANIIKLMERFDLAPFPREHMEKLKVNKAYRLDDIFTRLVDLGELRAKDYELFKTMLDMESAYRVDGDYVFRVKRTLMEDLRQAVSGFHVIDPDIED